MKPAEYLSSIEEILRQFYPYIVSLVWGFIYGNTAIAPSAVLDLVAEDIIQMSLIKLWLALLVEEKEILSLKSYVRSITYHEFISMIRSLKSDLPLPFDDDGELLQGKALFIQSEEMGNPEHVYEQKVGVTALLEETAYRVSKLSPKQQRAMICSLKERVDDLLQLTEALKRHGIDAEGFQWPETKEEIKGLKANVSPAREKLRSIEHVLA